MLPITDEDILDAIYACAVRDDALEQLLERLARRFRCPSAAFVFQDAARPSSNVAFGYGVFNAAAQARYRDEFAQDDPAPAAFAGLPIGYATATDRLFNIEQRASSRFLQEFYYPLGLWEALGAAITAEPDRFGIVAVQRGREREPFSDEEIAEFSNLARHIARAVGLRRRFFELSATANALDGSSPATLVYNGDLTLLHANERAREVLARADGLRLDRHGRLRADERGVDALLQQDFRSTSRLAQYRFVRRTNGSSYTTRVAREADGCISAKIFDPVRVSGDIPEALRTTIGLTPAAARLTSALAQGATLAEFAAANGISLNTAKFHLKSAFQATGTKRQIDLVRYLLALMRDLENVS